MPVRVAGWGTDGSGRSITWSVAEGRRGRRWREVVHDGGAVRHALLYETDTDGRFAHLELSSAAGLVSLHPEQDGTLHGNRVDPAGAMVDHVVGLPFSPEHLLLVEASTVAVGAAAWLLTGVVEVGKSVERPAVTLLATGRVHAAAAVRFERLTSTDWRIGDGLVLRLHADGWPILADGRTAPLELD